MMEITFLLILIGLIVLIDILILLLSLIIIKEYYKLQTGVAQKQQTATIQGPVSLGPGFGNGNNPYTP